MNMNPSGGPVKVNYHLTRVSRNAKVGPMPVATSSEVTCPTSCPFANGNGCYAKTGPLALHWNAITKGARGNSFHEFLSEIKHLPRKQIWRYGQAGDLPGVGDEIDADQMAQLVSANRQRPVISYTHKPLTEENTQVLRDAVAGGFHVNVSTETLEAADEAADQGFSAVVVLPSDYQRGKKEPLTEYRQRLKDFVTQTPKGRKVAVCPATYTETSCLECQACSRPRANEAVIGFPAHGTKKGTVDRRLNHYAGADP